MHLYKKIENIDDLDMPSFYDSNSLDSLKGLQFYDSRYDPLYFHDYDKTRVRPLGIYDDEIDGLIYNKAGNDEKQANNNLNDDDRDPFLNSLADKDPYLRNALNENKKYNSLINLDEQESLTTNPVILEVENFLETNIRNTNVLELKNRGDKIRTRLDAEIKSLKSRYRENNRAYLFGDMSPEFDIKVVSENSELVKEYNNLINLKEKLRSQINPDDEGYDSPIEALYSREELEGDLENASILLEGTDIVVNTIPVIKNQLTKGIVKGAKHGVRKLRNSSYIKGRRISVKKMVKSKGLPTKGKIRFVPRDADKKMGRILEKSDGYVDKFGNIWKKPKFKSQNVKDIHWDVQLSSKGKKCYAKFSRSGNHLNVTQKGTIPH